MMSTSIFVCGQCECVHVSSRLLVGAQSTWIGCAGRADIEDARVGKPALQLDHSLHGYSKHVGSVSLVALCLQAILGPSRGEPASSSNSWPRCAQFW